MTDRRRHDRLAVIALSFVFLVAACDSSTPSASPTPSPTASPTPDPTPAPSAAPSDTPAPPSGDPSQADLVYDEIEGQVIALRGLTPKSDVERQTISKDELSAMVQQLYEEETPPELVAGNERAYKALGLMPADESLRDLTIELLSGGVAGFYRDEEKKLYVVSQSGAIGGTEKMTFAHEFNHALQGQHFSVFADQEDVVDRSDWILARQAVYEGDSSLLMFKWATEELTMEELAEIVTSAANDPSVELFERMPPILSQTLQFPYSTGYAFANAQHASGGWAAIDALYADMPESTEQILHEDKWEAREAPVDVALPGDLASSLGSGWTIPWQDTFGEFQMRIWLADTGASNPTAAAAAAGWGGDRAAVLTGPNGAWALVWATEWDSAAEAAEFQAAASASLETLADPAALLPGAGGTSRWILVASDDATLTRVAGVLGLAE